MKSGVITVVAVAGLLAGTGVPAASASGRQPASSPRPAELTAAIEQVMREASIPGAVVGVWDRGMAPYVRAFGVADKATGQPMRTDMYLRIGSETKTFTITAVLELVDQKRIGLDDPIGKYIAGVPDGGQITIRDLADMRSGLFNYTDDPAFDQAAGRDPYRQWGPWQLLAYAFGHPMLFPPGSEYAYSNTNTILLGLLVQKVSGIPLNTFILRYVLQP